MSAATFDWERYGRLILAGEVPACKWTRLAVERHYRDLAEGPARGLRFSEEHAQHALEFFLFLRHSKGEWTGEQFVPSDWQQFWIAVMFGWLREDGTRRFRECYLRVARKNGKSTLISGIGLYLLWADGEGGAEVYTAATKRDQAKITHDEAIRMTRASLLARHLEIRREEILIPGKADKFVPLGRDSQSMDGLNPHGAIIDEYHAHKDNDVVEVLKTGMGARRQPLLVYITTAGTDLSGPCFRHDLFIQGLLQGKVDDDSSFGVIYELEEGDDFADPDVWIKANPNLGVSVYPEYLQQQVDTAQKNPHRRNAVLTKNFNRWMTGEVSWIEPEQWKRQAVADLTPADFAGCRNAIGLDLATKVDVASLVQVFERGGHYHVFARHYVPEEMVQRSANYSYPAWRDEGWLTATPGNVIDLDRIEGDVLAMSDNSEPEAVCFDPWQAQQMANHLVEAGVPMVEIRKTVQNLSEPMKEIQALALSGRLHHNGDPVLAWMINNVVFQVDRNDNIFPRKQVSENKIDAAVALIMAMSRLIRHGEEPESVYETMARAA